MLKYVPAVGWVSCRLDPHNHLGGGNYFPFLTDEETEGQRVKQRAEHFSDHLQKPLLPGLPGLEAHTAST